MPQQTLLQIVQSILTRIDSDTINSIGDTPESIQVAQIVKDKYNDIVARGSLTINKQLFQLTPSDNNTLPTLMYLPDGVSKVDWIKYYNTNPLENPIQAGQFGAFQHGLNVDLVSTVNWTTTSSTSQTIVSSGTLIWTVASSTLPITIGQIVQVTSGANTMTGKAVAYVGTSLTLAITNSTGSGTFSSWILSNVTAGSSPPGYERVAVVPIEYFLETVAKFDVTQNNVKIYNFNQSGNNFYLRYMNDRQPMICTIISNLYVLFDTYDSTQDSTLQASKTLGYGELSPAFLMIDGFVPQLDDIQFPLLINESLSTAFIELKQSSNPKAELETKRQWGVAQQWKSKSNSPTSFDQLPNFGRVPGTGGYGGYGYGVLFRDE